MQTEAQAKRVPLRFVLAVFVGNGLAFYDFVTFSYFSVYIGRTFFPSHDPTASLLASLATFWLGFLTRPIGAAVLGSMGDRRGRKPAMLLTFLLLGISIAGIALTPSYAAIGTAAPVLVILFRLLQGFALGGEVGPTTAYMAESVPARRRGLYISMQYATQDCAGLLAGLIGVGWRACSATPSSGSGAGARRCSSAPPSSLSVFGCAAICPRRWSRPRRAHRARSQSA